MRLHAHIEFANEVFVTPQQNLKLSAHESKLLHLEWNFVQGAISKSMHCCSGVREVSAMFSTTADQIAHLLRLSLLKEAPVM